MGASDYVRPAHHPRLPGSVPQYVPNRVDMNGDGIAGFDNRTVSTAGGSYTTPLTTPPGSTPGADPNVGGRMQGFASRYAPGATAEYVWGNPRTQGLDLLQE